MPADRVPTGIESGRGQLLAQLDDQLDRLGGIAVGTVFGRRERRSNAASPSTRYRARSYSQERETPYWAATSGTGRFSVTTAVMTSL
jgi:hypothetical protein